MSGSFLEAYGLTMISRRIKRKALAFGIGIDSIHVSFAQFDRWKRNMEIQSKRGLLAA
jgi:uncharacterized membrane protein YidH (DUF202 family)